MANRLPSQVAASTPQFQGTGIVRGPTPHEISPLAALQPLVTSTVEKAKSDIQDKRALAIAFANMNRLGTPGTAAEGQPTLDMAGMNFPVTQAPIDYGAELNRLKTENFGDPTWQDIIKLQNAMFNSALFTSKEPPSFKQTLSELEALGVKMPKTTTTADMKSPFDKKKKGRSMKAKDGTIVDGMSDADAQMAKYKGWVEVD